MRSLFILSIFLFTAVGANASIIIENDEDDCIDGWISMDIVVEVDEEKFDFNPSCGFSFDERFETESGKKCKVAAGMCSVFSPEKRFEVECDDGASEGIDIKCPEE